jgi:hypothetical protein
MSEEVSVYALDKKSVNIEHYVVYNNEILENSQGMYPLYIEVIQSTNFIYLILEKLSRPVKGSLTPHLIT